MDKNYIKLMHGIDEMGDALIQIGQSKDNKPIKLLVARLIGKLGFNDQSVGDDIAMIRFAVDNDDESLEKLTANITGGEAETPIEIKSDAKITVEGDVTYPDKDKE